MKHLEWLVPRTKRGCHYSFPVGKRWPCVRHEDLAVGCVMALSPFSLAGVSLQPSGKQPPRRNGKGKRVMGSQGKSRVGGGAPEPPGSPQLRREGGSQEDRARESLRLPSPRGSLGGQVTGSPRAQMPAEEGCVGQKASSGTPAKLRVAGAAGRVASADICCGS